MHTRRLRPLGVPSVGPSSSGSACSIQGTTPTVGTPVARSSSAGAGASRPSSPRNLLSRNPQTCDRQGGGSSAQVPYRWAKAPPRSMSATSSTGAPASSATRMLTMSSAHRLVSAGLPAPSTTTAASACSHWAVPISPPSTTRALFDMFWALKGATSAPRRRSHRHSAVAIRLLPASLDTPCTMIVATARHPPTATGRIGSYQPAAPATPPTQQRRPSGQQARSEHKQHRPYVSPPILSDCQGNPLLAFHESAYQAGARLAGWDIQRLACPGGITDPTLCPTPG